MDIHAMTGYCFQAISPLFIRLDISRARAACFLTCPAPVPTQHMLHPVALAEYFFNTSLFAGPWIGLRAHPGSVSGEGPAQDIGQEDRRDSCPISTPVGLWHPVTRG